MVDDCENVIKGWLYLVLPLLILPASRDIGMALLLIPLISAPILWLVAVVAGRISAMVSAGFTGGVAAIIIWQHLPL